MDNCSDSSDEVPLARPGRAAENLLAEPLHRPSQNRYQQREKEYYQPQSTGSYMQQGYDRTHSVAQQTQPPHTGANNLAQQSAYVSSYVPDNASQPLPKRMRREPSHGGSIDPMQQQHLTNYGYDWEDYGYGSALGYPTWGRAASYSYPAYSGSYPDPGEWDMYCGLRYKGNALPSQQTSYHQSIPAGAYNPNFYPASPATHIHSQPYQPLIHSVSNPQMTCTAPDDTHADESDGRISVKRKYDYRLDQDPVEQYEIKPSLARRVRVTMPLPRRASMAAVSSGAQGTGQGAHLTGKQNAPSGMKPAPTQLSRGPSSVYQRLAAARIDSGSQQQKPSCPNNDISDEELTEDEETCSDAGLDQDDDDYGDEDIPTDGLVRVKYYGTCTTCSSENYHCMPSKTKGTCLRCEKNGLAGCNLVREESAMVPEQGWLRPLPHKLDTATVQALNKMAMTGHKAMKPCKQCRTQYGGDGYPCWVAASEDHCHTCRWKKQRCDGPSTNAGAPRKIEGITPAILEQPGPNRPRRSTKVRSVTPQSTSSASETDSSEGRRLRRKDAGYRQQHYQMKVASAPGTLLANWGPGWKIALSPYIKDIDAIAASVALAAMTHHRTTLSEVQALFRNSNCDKMNATAFQKWSQQVYRPWLQSRQT